MTMNWRVVNRIWLVLGVALLLARPLPSVKGQSTASVAVTPAKSQVPLGNAITVRLAVNGGENVNAFDVTVDYDAGLLALADWAHGDYLSNLAVVKETNEPGRLRIAATQLATPAVSGDGILLELHFNTKSAGLAQIEISEAIFATPTGTEFFPNWVGGEVSVTNDPTYTPIPSITPTPLSTHTATATQSPTQTSTPIVLPTHTATATQPPTQTPTRTHTPTVDDPKPDPTGTPVPTATATTQGGPSQNTPTARTPSATEKATTPPTQTPPVTATPLPTGLATEAAARTATAAEAQMATDAADEPQLRWPAGTATPEGGSEQRTQAAIAATATHLADPLPAEHGQSPPSETGTQAWLERLLWSALLLSMIAFLIMLVLAIRQKNNQSEDYLL
jgi:hypothetical protein